MIAVARWLAAVFFAALIANGPAKAETIACPAKVLSPPRSGTPDDAAQYPGWTVMWTPMQLPLSDIQVYVEPPEVDLRRWDRVPPKGSDGKPMVLTEADYYWPASYGSHVEPIETKTRTGNVVVFKDEKIDPASAWLVCRYPFPFALYRKLSADISRCEQYQKKDARGRPIGPLIGECR